MLALSIGVAILRHRLYDIDVVVNRSLLYGGLTVSVVALSAAIVGLLGLLIPDTALLSLLGAAVAVALVRPLRARAQHLVNRVRDQSQSTVRLHERGTRVDAAPGRLLHQVTHLVLGEHGRGQLMHPPAR